MSQRLAHGTSLAAVVPISVVVAHQLRSARQRRLARRPVAGDRGRRRRGDRHQAARRPPPADARRSCSSAYWWPRRSACSSPPTPTGAATCHRRHGRRPRRHRRRDGHPRRTARRRRRHRHGAGDDPAVRHPAGGRQGDVGRRDHPRGDDGHVAQPSQRQHRPAGRRRHRARRDRHGGDRRDARRPDERRPVERAVRHAAAHRRRPAGVGAAPRRGGTPARERWPSTSSPSSPSSSAPSPRARRASASACSPRRCWRSSTRSSCPAPCCCSDCRRRDDRLAESAVHSTGSASSGRWSVACSARSPACTPSPARPRRSVDRPRRARAPRRRRQPQRLARATDDADARRGRHGVGRDGDDDVGRRPADGARLQREQAATLRSTLAGFFLFGASLALADTGLSGELGRHQVVDGSSCCPACSSGSPSAGCSRRTSIVAGPVAPCSACRRWRPRVLVVGSLS